MKKKYISEIFLWHVVASYFGYIILKFEKNSSRNVHFIQIIPAQPQKLMKIFIFQFLHLTKLSRSKASMFTKMQQCKHQANFSPISCILSHAHTLHHTKSTHYNAFPACIHSFSVCFLSRFYSSFSSLSRCYKNNMPSRPVDSPIHAWVSVCFLVSLVSLVLSTSHDCLHACLIDWVSECACHAFFSKKYVCERESECFECDCLTDWVCACVSIFPVRTAFWNCTLNEWPNVW